MAHDAAAAADDDDDDDDDDDGEGKRCIVDSYACIYALRMKSLNVCNPASMKELCRINALSTADCSGGMSRKIPRDCDNCKYILQNSIASPRKKRNRGKIS